MNTPPVHSRLASARELKGLSLREVGAKLKLSHNAVSLFELGRLDLPPLKRKGYAKLMGLDPAVVHREHLQAALAYHLRRVRELRTTLKSVGAAGKRGRKISAL